MIWQPMSLPASNSHSAPARLAFGVLCTLVCISLLAIAQSQQAPEPQAIIRRQVNLVLVDVAVTDSKGVLIGGLHASNFELLDEGAEQEISHFSQDEIPLAIALVVDVSRSMRPIMEPVRNALVRALPTLKAEDRVALFSFASYCKLEISLTNDFSAIARRIVELQPSRGTDVDDALVFATAYLHERAPSGRRVIILLSDTLSRAGAASDYQVEKKLMNSEIGLFGIRQAGNLPMSYRDKHLTQIDANQMARASGGFILDVPHPKGFEAAMESLIKFLKARYTLGFYPNSAGKTRVNHEIKVQLKDTHNQKGLSHAKLQYRLRYQVPSEAPAKSP